MDRNNKNNPNAAITIAILIAVAIAILLLTAFAAKLATKLEKTHNPCPGYALLVL
jgi:hypothetical protein